MLLLVEQVQTVLESLRIELGLLLRSLEGQQVHLVRGGNEVRSGGFGVWFDHGCIVLGMMISTLSEQIWLDQVR